MLKGELDPETKFNDCRLFLIKDDLWTFEIPEKIVNWLQYKGQDLAL